MESINFDNVLQDIINNLVESLIPRVNNTEESVKLRYRSVNMSP